MHTSSTLCSLSLSNRFVHLSKTKQFRKVLLQILLAVFVFYRPFSSVHQVTFFSMCNDIFLNHKQQCFLASHHHLFFIVTSAYEKRPQKAKPHHKENLKEHLKTMFTPKKGSLWRLVIVRHVMWTFENCHCIYGDSQATYQPKTMHSVLWPRTLTITKKAKFLLCPIQHREWDTWLQGELTSQTIHKWLHVQVV